MSTLTAEERERGWVEHACDEHGFLVATTPRAFVTCRCGKTARILRSGRIVNEETLKPTAAKGRELNKAGQPFIYGCGSCGEDFGGETLLRRHRAGGAKSKRCLTAREMADRGWSPDKAGRWREAGAYSREKESTSSLSEAVEAFLGPQEAEDAKSPVRAAKKGTSTDFRPAPWSNPTRNWKRGKPGSRDGETARRARGTNTRQGFVYFFQGDTTRRIKIGFSSDPERRLEELRRAGVSEAIRLLGSIPGTFGDEAAHHRQNANAWEHREWFRGDLLPEVAELLGVDLAALEAIPFG